VQQVWRSKQDVTLIPSLRTANRVETLKEELKSVKWCQKYNVILIFHGARGRTLTRLHVSLRHQMQ
jgi:hypothetical protein